MGAAGGMRFLSCDVFFFYTLSPIFYTLFNLFMLPGSNFFFFLYEPANAVIYSYLCRQLVECTVACYPAPRRILPAMSAIYESVALYKALVWNFTEQRSWLMVFFVFCLCLCASVCLSEYMYGYTLPPLPESGGPAPRWRRPHSMVIARNI